MRIISWNTNGIRSTHKAGLFLPLFAKYKPDMVCVQETKAEAEQLPDEIRNIPGYQAFFSHSKGRKGYSGVGTYTKIKTISTHVGFTVKDLDDEGRTMVTYFDSPVGEVALINCYFPNGGSGPVRLEFKLKFYDEFLKFIDRLRKDGKKVIFCGDVNTAHEEIDLARPKANEDNTGFLPIERAWIDEVIAHGYVDVFRHKYPTKTDAYTYWDQKTAARDRNVGWRIDYFFVSPELVKDIKATSILSDYYGSDHCPILLDIF